MHFKHLIPYKIDLIILPLLAFGFIWSLNIAPIPYMAFDDWATFSKPDFANKLPKQNGRWATAAFVSIYKDLPPLTYKLLFLLLSTMGSYIWIRQFLKDRNPLKIALGSTLLFLCPILLYLSIWPFVSLSIAILIFTYAVSVSFFPKHKFIVLLIHCFIGQMTYNLMPFYFLSLYILETDFKSNYRKLAITVISFYAMFAASVLAGACLNYIIFNEFGNGATEQKWRLLSDPVSIQDLFMRYEIFVNKLASDLNIGKIWLALPFALAVWIFVKKRFTITKVALVALIELVFIFCIQYHTQLKFEFRSSPELWVVFISPILIGLCQSERKINLAAGAIALMLICFTWNAWIQIYDIKESTARHLNQNILSIKEASEGKELVVHIKSLTETTPPKHWRYKWGRPSEHLLFYAAPKHIRNQPVSMIGFVHRMQYIYGYKKVIFCQTKCKGISKEDFSEPFLKGNQIIYHDDKAHILVEVYDRRYRKEVLDKLR